MIINLIDKRKTEVPYKIIKFPDGQISVELDLGIAFDAPPKYFRIVSRASWADLEIISNVVNAIRFSFSTPISLVAPYISARSDRRFNDNQAHYLKEVYAPVINSLNFEVVSTFDPHSDVLEAVIDALEVVPNFGYVKSVVSGMKGKKLLVVPDGGALKKAYNISHLFDNMLVCQKHRDIKTGEILGINIHETDKLQAYSNIVVVDDIIDGGATFTEIGRQIREFSDMRPKPSPRLNLVLIVSHGIFSKGYDTLTSIYDKIHTTNSVKDFAATIPENIFVHDALDQFPNL